MSKFEQLQEVIEEGFGEDGLEALREFIPTGSKGEKGDVLFSLLASNYEECDCLSEGVEALIENGVRLSPEKMVALQGEYVMPSCMMLFLGSHFTKPIEISRWIALWSLGQDPWCDAFDPEEETSVQRIREMIE